MFLDFSEGSKLMTLVSLELQEKTRRSKQGFQDSVD